MATSAKALYYMCSFSLGNFTYLYRCRIADQYCCGHTCCFKQINDEPQNIFASWYFWSLILVVLLVFGCIIVSFALSSLKQRHDIESWGMLAGTAFNNLATTITGKHGIIQPKLHYQKRKKKKQTAPLPEPHQQTLSESLHEQAQGYTQHPLPTRPNTAGGRLSQLAVRQLIQQHYSPQVSTDMPAVGASEEDPGATRPPPHPQMQRTLSFHGLPTTNRSTTPSTAYTIFPSSTSGSRSQTPAEGRVPSGRHHADWVEVHLTPLQPAYKSSWTGNPMEMRLAASTQVFFPPGFINS